MAAAAPYARVMEDMLKGRELATQLQGLLRDSPETGGLVDQILHAISRTIDTARSAAAGEEGSEVQSEVTCGGKRKAASGAGGGDRRGPCRRRAQQSCVVTKTMTMKDMDDGYAWRKYGQKDIQNSKHPKAYFRCTHKYDQHCAAQRQVQLCDDDTDTYTVTYIGKHTCHDPTDAVAPLAVHAAGMADDGLHAGSRLICFAPSASAATTSTTTTTTTTAGQQQADHKDAVLPVPSGLRPLKVEGGGDLEQEEVLSSLTPPGSSAAQRNAAATPGPDQGDVTSGLQQQQHFYDDGVDMATLMYGYDDGTFLNLEDLFGLDQGIQGRY